MRKIGGFFSIILVVGALAAADLYILTRARSLAMLAEGELRKIAGDVLEWNHISAEIDNVLTLQGTVTLEGVRGFPLARRLPPVQARRARIHLRSGFPERFDLEDVHGVISDELFDELVGKDTGKSIRDVFPDPSRLPRITVRGGRFETRLSAVFEGGRPQNVAIGNISLTPIGGYRYHLEGEFTSELLGRWTERGEVDLDTGAQRLSLDCIGLRITPALREPLIENFRRIYDRYLPGGLCDIHVVIQKEARQEPDVRVNLIARDMTFTYANFPYPADQITGEIEFLSDHFVIKHMRGHHGPATLRFDGSAGGYTGEAGFAFRIEIDDMPLDDALGNALDPGSRKVLQSFSPRGKVSARGRAIREPGRDSKEHIPLDLSFQDVKLKYDGFPYELEKVSGEIRVDGSWIDVKHATVRNGPLQAEVRGRIGDISGDASVDLSIDAMHLPLDDRLRAAIGDEARKTWDLFSPGGELEVHWHLEKQKGGQVVHTARARCQGNTALYRDLPLKATGLSGDIEMSPGRFHLEHLTGKVKGADIEVDGTITDGQVALHVDATSLLLDEEIKNALPTDVGDFLKVIKLGGTVSFQSGLTFKKNGSRNIDLVCKLQKGFIDTEPRFEDIDGTVTLTAYIDKEAMLQGFVNFSTATIAGKRITDVGASFNRVGSTLNFLNLKGTAYGGILAGRSFTLDTKTKEFQSDALTLDRVELQDFIRDTKAYSNKTMSGKVSLEIWDLKGNSLDSGTISAKGRIRIRDAVLWDIPVFLKLFTLNPGELFKTRNRFDAGGVEFEIRNRKIVIQHMAFTGESVSVVGQGHVGFDGDLDLVLKPRSGPLLGLDFFIFDWAGILRDVFVSSVVSVEVKGTFDKPEIK